jgi:hypothetical protein
MDTTLAVLVIGVAVASFGFLARLLYAVWSERGWLPPEKEDRSDEEFSSGQQSAFDSYSSEDCYKYCKEHPELDDADAWVPCEDLCRS